MELIIKILGRRAEEYPVVFCKDRPHSLVVSWEDMDNIHSHETVRKTVYVGNYIMEDSVRASGYACFNVIPAHPGWRVAHVAVKI